MQLALAVVLVVSAGLAGATEPIVLENASPQPFVYHFHNGFQRDKEVPWTAPLTIPTGERRTVAAPVPLVIGFHDGAEWRSFTLQPGNAYRFHLNAQGGAGLYFAGPVPAPEVVREIRVLAVADNEYRNRFPEWEPRVRGLIASASRCYEQEFGIRFTVVDCKPWKFNARYQRTLEEKLASMQRIDLGSAEMMVAFIRAVHPIGGATAIGWGMRLSPYALVTDSWPELADIIPLAYREKIWREPGFGSTVTLVHELGHALGAFHLASADSIMYPNPVKMIPPRIQFDDVTRRVIRASRNSNLRLGPESISRQAALEIRDLYRRYRLPSEPVDGDPISGAYRDGATRAQAANQPDLAAQLNRRADTWWREGTPVGHTVGYPGSAWPAHAATVAEPAFEETRRPVVVPAKSVD